jgi:hypothetical protein
MSVIKIQSVNMVWGRNRCLFLVSNFRRVLIVVFFLLGESPASEFYVPTFRNAVCSIFISGISTSYEDGKVFRNVDTFNSYARESPKIKNTNRYLF